MQWKNLAASIRYPFSSNPQFLKLLSQMNF